MKKSTKYLIFLAVSAVSIYIGILQINTMNQMENAWNNAHPLGDASGQDAGMLGIGDNHFLWGAVLIGIPILILIALATGRIFKRTNDALFYKVPTPAEIHVQLWQERGYEPSLQDVESVHTMLINQHNQELIVAGITLGGLLAAHELNKR